MTLALYRAYRPGSLAEVVGQEHVTEPLRRALDSGRTHHAYLFSGPRGCGKTSTARILARSLNCETGPTSTPCGRCDSCIALAPNGPGSTDVVELDAASHGRVEDTRELRDQVIFSPSFSRYRVYIIDEAHMVTTQGFNALLKVVEEPPEHVRFIFATTEPEKVLPTIRSRTFTYAFRLVPVPILQEHLAGICRSEGVAAEPAALGLVAKASGGSVRDSLSLLGQLIAGAGPDGLVYDEVSRTLGVTDALVLDRAIDALASRDARELFLVVEDVVAAGHDVRRFLSDLLDRLRDLIVIQNVAPSDLPGLLDLPADQVGGLTAQAQRFGAGHISWTADTVSRGLTEVKGATAPRLQLELLAARLLLPAVSTDTAALLARVDLLERGAPVASATAPAGAPPGAPSEPGSAEAPPSVPRPSSRAKPKRLSDVAPATTDRVPPVAAPEAGAPELPGPAAAQPQTPSAPAALPGAGDDTTMATIRAGWDAVIAEVRERSKVAWTLWESSAPSALDGRVLTVNVIEPGRAERIRTSKRDELMRQVLLDVLGVDVRVAAVAAGVIDRSSPTTPKPAPSNTAPSNTAPPNTEPSSSSPAPIHAVKSGPAEPTHPEPTSRSAPSRRSQPRAAVAVAAHDGASPDDPDIEDAGLAGVPLAEKLLGAQHIGEIEIG